MKHQAGKREVVESGESLGEPFVIACPASEACRPGKATFHNPAPRQQHEATFCFSVFDHFQTNAIKRSANRVRFPPEFIGRSATITL